MKEDKLIEKIEIPEGISAEVKDNKLVLKKDDKVLIRVLNPKVNFEVKGKEIVIGIRKADKKSKQVFGTMKTHTRNMIKGLNEGFTYKMKIANVHFPMTAEVDSNSNELIVRNFLGEKQDRRIKLVKDVDVKVNKEDIEINSSDIEKAGQVAANIEKGTKVRNKDRRIYQDGIFIVEKPGRVFI